MIYWLDELKMFKIVSRMT